LLVVRADQTLVDTFCRRQHLQTKIIATILLIAAAATSVMADQGSPTLIAGFGDENPPASTQPSPGLMEREKLTGDWGGARSWLKEHGITINPRLTQFYQGMPVGDGAHGFEYGGKADLLLNADLSKLYLWKGLSLTLHGEYNFGESLNGRGGTIAPVNTALYFPGIEGGDAYDLSSVYLGQRFGDSVSLLVGKINIVDLASTKPFMGGAGIDAFWNSVFVATPSGTVPPYLLGAILTARTDIATIGLWVYDPDSYVNRSPFDDPFNDGITVRVPIDFPVTIFGLSGHQGLVGTYSTKDGQDLSSIRDMLIPNYPPSASIKSNRYYAAYTFDQYLYQSKDDPKQGFGLFGQFGISDGNPNRLYALAMVGIGGMGLIPGRSRDNWGIGCYYAAPSRDLKDSLNQVVDIRDEQGIEVFYNFSVTPWLTVGADIQVIRPSLADDTAVFCGMRTVINF
jgi:porin